MAEIKCCSVSCHPVELPVANQNKPDFFTDNTTKFSDIYSSMYDKIRNQNKELNDNLDKIIALRVACEKLNYDTSIEANKNNIKSIFKDFSKKYLEIMEIYNKISNINNSITSINEMAILLEHPSKLGNGIESLYNKNEVLDAEYLSNYMVDTNIMPFNYMVLDNNYNIKTIREKITEHYHISNLVIQRLMGIIQECNSMRNNLAKKIRQIPLV
jgi:hypothetical protein